MKLLILIGLIVATLTGSIVASAGGHSGQRRGEPRGQQVAEGEAGLGAASTGRLVKRGASGESDGDQSAVGQLESFMKGDLRQQQHEQANSKDPFGELIKLILNPVELARRVASVFKLDFDKLSGLVGKNLLYGLEAAFAPVVVSMKLVEKVFVPDACALKFVCSMGSHLSFLKANVLRVSSETLEGSIAIKALGDGIIGRDCEAAYPSCANNMLTIRKEVRKEAGLSGGAELVGSLSAAAGGQKSDEGLLAGLVGQANQGQQSSQELLGSLRSMLSEQFGGGAGGQPTGGQKQQGLFGLA